MCLWFTIDLLPPLHAISETVLLPPLTLIPIQTLLLLILLILSASSAKLFWCEICIDQASGWCPPFGTLSSAVVWHHLASWSFSGASSNHTQDSGQEATEACTCYRHY